MEKKNLKWYDTPQVEVVEMKMQGILCVSTNAGNADSDEMGDGGHF